MESEEEQTTPLIDAAAAVFTTGSTPGEDETENESRPGGLTRAQALNLYVSHALSTWNARGYEFAAILFTAAAYPDTLVAAALRMIIIYIAMILLSSTVGHWVERSPNRLRTLLSTILCNRASVVLGSLFWLLIIRQEDHGDNNALKGFIFAMAIACGIVERLSASANMISMERDWVVTVAAPPAGQRRRQQQQQHVYDLTHLNAIMRRIDLVCKLLSPILISLVISGAGSVRIGVLYTACASLISLPIEVVSAKRVWDRSTALQCPKSVPLPSGGGEGGEGGDGGEQHHSIGDTDSRLRLRRLFKGIEMYFSTTVWMPSLSLAILHFNMLTWRATFITYLLNVGFSLNAITVARTVGSLFEISSTVITPKGIVYLGKTTETRTRLLNYGEQQEAEEAIMNQEVLAITDGQTVVGLQRLGLWGLSGQLINTIPVVLAIWMISQQREHSQQNTILTILGLDKSHTPSTTLSAGVSSSRPSISIPWSIVLFSFLSFSRLGVWIYDLTTQQLTQTLVRPTQRARFAGVENSVVNVFEVLGAAAAIAFPRVENYPWLAMASLAAVVLSWCIYACWVRAQRGHLVHWEKLGHGRGTHGRRG